MQMMSLRGKVFLAAHEAIVLRRYLDSVGVWTIGIGVTAAAGASINPETYHGRITVRHAIDLMIAVLPQYEDAARKAAQGKILKQHEFDALVSLAYNVGPQLGYSWKRDTRRLIAEGKVGDAISLWRGSLKRRGAEIILASTGDYGNDLIRVMSANSAGVPFDLYRLSQSELMAQLTPHVPAEHRNAGSPQTGWVGV